MTIFNLFALLGGLGLFIYGMNLMSDGLEAAAGNKMRKWLGIVTKNRFSGLLLGTGMTIAVQSSSATTVMVVGFVNAGLISLKQAVSICMGANIGTTVTAQILAFDFDKFAPLILFIGIVMIMFVKNREWQKIGQIIAGFGILFMGMMFMSESMEGLKDWQPFIDILSSFESPVIGILAGTIITAIMQASGATMAMLLALGSTGLISLDNSMYVILGLNIGTCITAILASMKANKTAKRTAVVHVLFNVIGTLIFVVLLNVLPIQEWIYSLSPDSVERQLANFHMMFNIVTTLILIWFPGLLIRLSYLFVRGEDPKGIELKLQYLIPSMLDNPPVAVSMTVKEAARMAGIARDNIALAMESFLKRDGSRIHEIKKTEETVNYLNHQITDFLAKLSQEELPVGDSRSVSALFHVVMDIERISDHAENIGEFTEYEIDKNVILSLEGKREITTMMDKVSEALDNAVKALADGDVEAADKVIEIEQEVDDLETILKDNHVERLGRGECSIGASMMYVDLVTNLERVSDHSTNIAYRVKQDGIYK